MSRNSRAVFCSLLAFTLLALSTPVLNAQNIFNKPQSGGYLAAKAFKSGQLRMQSGSVINQVNPDLTCSPAPCAFTPVKVSNLGSSMVDEDPVAVNPNNAMQILSGGNDYNCGNIQGWYASSDGGSTWKDTCSPGSGGEGDPIVGYDGNNVAYAGGIQNGVIVVSSSTNNGQTWGTPVKAVKNELGYLADKPWMEIDNTSNSAFKNTLYISTTQFDFSSGSQIWVAHSTDGGKTWKDVAVSTKQKFPGMVDQFSDLAIGADGTVYLNWLRCPTNGSAGDCGGTTSKIMFSKSTDGGMTWSAEAQAATTKLVPDTGCCFYGTLPNTSERVSNIPANAASGSGSTATVYATYYNWTGTQMQIMVVKSADGGTTWGTPVRANASNTGDQFFPWTNLASNGRKLAVTWLDRRNDPANVKYQPFFSSSLNGTSFTKDHALSSTLSDPFKDGFGGGFMGDYYSNAWGGRALYMVYPDTGTGIIQDTITGVQF